jgi:hypothetical protein
MGILARFRRDERGGVAVMAALVAIPLFGLAGAAVDYSNAARLRTLFQEAADKAVIAGAHAAPGRGGAEGERHFLVHARAEFASLTLPAIQVTDAGDEVRLHMGGGIPTGILGVIGWRTIPIEVRAAAKRTMREDPCDRAALARSEILVTRGPDGRPAYQLCRIENRAAEPGPRRYGNSCRPVTRDMCGGGVAQVRLAR